MKITITFILLLLLGGCSVIKRNNPRLNVYIRITNIDTVTTSGYIIGESRFSGLKPGDTSEYKLVKEFCFGNDIGVELDSIIISRSITHYHIPRLRNNNITLGIRLYKSKQGDIRLHIVDLEK